MKALKIVFIVLIISSVIAIFWDNFTLIRDSVHYILDPTAGSLLDYDVNSGMIIITAVIILFITIVQKYTVDNESLKQLKDEQKLLQKDMKEFKDHPEKILELQKKSISKAGEIFTLSLRSFSYTAIPIILFFRWFNDYFSAFDPPLKIFGFLGWIWTYFIFSIIFSLIFRKLLRLP